MNGWQYFKDKLGFISVQLFIYGLVMLSCSIWEIPFIICFLITLLWFVPLCTYFMYEYWRIQAFYKETTRLVQTLDQAYLLPVVMKKPQFLTGKIVFEWLNITNRDMHEHVKQATIENMEYQTYVATWVHEIKTPLAALNLLLQHVEVQKRFEMKKQLQHVEAYVEQALYYVKSAQANEDYHVKQFIVQTVIRRAIQTHALALRAKNIQIVLADEKTPVASDPKWVQFIFQQIIQNACQYSYENTTITIEVTNENEAVQVIFRDQGIGIIAHELPHVFKKGYTGSNGREFSPSTGIGLYISQRLAQKLHLQLVIESEQQIGTTVSVVFPLSTHQSICIQ
ncbi:MAG: sensor histidine kinase [Culicoidibacterales bacterium]